MISPDGNGRDAMTTNRDHIRAFIDPDLEETDPLLAEYSVLPYYMYAIRIARVHKRT